MDLVQYVIDFGTANDVHIGRAGYLGTVADPMNPWETIVDTVTPLPEVDGEAYCAFGKEKDGRLVVCKKNQVSVDYYIQSYPVDIAKDGKKMMKMEVEKTGSGHSGKLPPGHDAEKNKKLPQYLLDLLMDRGFQGLKPSADEKLCCMIQKEESPCDKKKQTRRNKQNENKRKRRNSV